MLMMMMVIVDDEMMKCRLDAFIAKRYLCECLTLHPADHPTYNLIRPISRRLSLSRSIFIDLYSVD